MEKLLIFGKSMKPFYKEGSYVYFDKISFDELKLRNLIVFRKKAKAKLIVHRIVKINRDRKLVFTKGDNSKLLDLPITEDFILGKVAALEKKGKICRISRSRENFQYLISRIYVKTKNFFNSIVYLLFPHILSVDFLRKVFIKKKYHRSKRIYFLINKKFAVYGKKRNNYLYVNQHFLRHSDKIKKFIENEMEMMEKPNNTNFDIVFRQEEQEGILYNAKTGDLKILNETACFIYSIFSKSHSIEKVVNELISVYDIEKQEAEKEVNSFIQELREKNLL